MFHVAEEPSLEKGACIANTSFSPGISWPFINARGSSCSPDADQRSDLFSL